MNEQAPFVTLRGTMDSEISPDEQSNMLAGTILAFFANLTMEQWNNMDHIKATTETCVQMLDGCGFDVQHVMVFPHALFVQTSQYAVTFQQAGNSLHILYLPSMRYRLELTATVEPLEQ